MKSSLSYLVKFLEDNTILSKKYLDNCALGEPDWRLIIITIYNKSIFFANNNYQKF